MTLTEILNEIKNRVTHAGIARCVDVQPDGSLPQVQFPIHDEATGELAPGRIAELAAKYYGKYKMAMPCEILCDVQQKGGYLAVGKQVIYVTDADTVHYGSQPIANYVEGNDDIPKADKWFGVMEVMKAAGMIDSWAFVNTEQTGLGGDVIGNVKLIKDGTAINLDGTPAAGDGVISLWENKDGDTIQIARN
jgi:hypothetical protein